MPLRYAAITVTQTHVQLNENADCGVFLISVPQFGSEEVLWLLYRTDRVQVEISQRAARDSEERDGALP